MPVKLFTRIRGSGSMHLIGQDFWANDIVALDIDPKPFDVNSDAQGPISKRAGGRNIQVKFTPVGVLGAAQLAVMFPPAILDPRIGDFITPVRQATAADHTAGTWTIPGHGFLTGTGTRLGGVNAASVLPAGLSATTTYFVHAVDADTVKFYDTEAHAITGSGAGLVAFTDNGTLPFAMVQNTPFIVTTVDGAQLTVFNAAVITPPPLSLHSLNTAPKQIVVEGYTQSGMDWSDDDSLYGEGSGVITAPLPDQATIPTVPYTVDWGTLNGLEPREAIDVTVKVTLDDVMSQSGALITRSIKKVEATAEFVPTNLSVSDLLAQLALQGGSAAPGQALPSALLNMYGPGSNPYIRVYGATLVTAPMRFGSSADRVDKLQFQNVRTATDGVMDPVIFIGNAAPV